MNIGSGKGHPLSKLCSDSLHSFVMDGVSCTSLDSFIQSLKFEKPSQQVVICKENPKAARERGKKAMEWKNSQVLWWKGKSFDRRSEDHQALIERVVEHVAQQCIAFRTALLDTGLTVLESSAKSKEFDTPVTEAEYCRALTIVREKIKPPKH